MDTTDLQAGTRVADSADDASSKMESWRPGGDSNPRSVPASDGRDVDNRSLFFDQTQGREETFPSPEIQTTETSGSSGTPTAQAPIRVGDGPAVVEASVLASASATPNPCVHWWVLPTPQGETSLGVCKFCHEEREFPNGFVGITISDHKGGSEFMSPIEPSGIARYIP